MATELTVVLERLLVAMEIAIQAVRNKTTPFNKGTQDSILDSNSGNDSFLRDIAQARAVFASLDTRQGGSRSLTPEEVKHSLKIIAASINSSKKYEIK